MTDSDVTLWTAWRERRDERAFEALVGPHLAFASAFARRLGCGAADADDAVQDALVALATESRDRPVRVGVRAWLGRRVWNEVRMARRSGRRREAREVRAVRRRPASDTSLVEAVARKDDVEAALAALGTDDRRLVELRFLHDLEYRELAFVEGRSALACRVRVHRAIGRLRRTLGRGAAILVASIALPASSASAATVVRRAVQAAKSGAEIGAGLGAFEGGLVVGTSGKVAAATVLVLALAGGVWGVFRRDEGAKSSVATDTPVSPSANASRAAPAELAGSAASRPSSSAAAATAKTEPTGEGTSATVDAAIKDGLGAVAGKLTFDDGTPVPHVRLALSIVPQNLAETDVEGRFRLEDERVAPRPLTLVQPDGTVLILGQIELEANRRVTPELRIARGVVVSGLVRSVIAREPLAGVAVTLRRLGAPNAGALQAGYGGAKTDAAGRFRFEHVPAARYTVELMSRGKGPTLTPFVVGAADVALDFDLAPSRPLVVRYEPMPVEAKGVKMAWMLSSSAPAEERFVLTSRGNAEALPVADDGTLVLDAPPPGRYDLILFGSGVLPRFETSIEITVDAVPTIRVPVAPGGRVVGTLLDMDGAPVVGAKVRVGGIDAAAPTDTRGGFVVARAPAGRQRMSRMLDSFRLALGEVDVAPDRQTFASARLPGSATFKATFIAPPYGALMTLVDASGRTVATGNPGARDVVEVTGLAAGVYRLTAHATSGPLTREVILRAGETTDVGEFALVPTPVVPVRLELPPGVERPTWVTVVRSMNLSSSPAQLWFGVGHIEFDAQGRGWLKEVPAGRQRLFLQVVPEMNEADLTEVEIEVRDGITIPIEIRIREFTPRRK